MRRPGLLMGALVGALLTAPLIGVLFLAWQTRGFPFVPFDLFDWLARVLPGQVITFTIETMVGLIRVLHLGPTATVAKTAEQAAGVATFFAGGVLAAGMFFALLRRAAPAGCLPGVLLGALMGVASASVSRSGQTAAVSPAAGIAWIMAASLAWGAALAWARDRFVAFSRAAGAPARLEALNRRQFLIRLGTASAAITVIGATVGALSRGKRRVTAAAERWSAAHPLPNAGAPVEPVQGTRPELTPLERHYRIDINTVPPSISEEEWRLSLTGLVERPLALTLDDLRTRYEPTDKFITLSCISNFVGGDLIGTQRWTGVSLQRIVSEMRPLPTATHLKITSADGFYEFVDLETIRSDPRVMLTYAWDGVPLPAEHGFPLRIYIPDRYGMKQPKWIQLIEVVDHAGRGYWVERGWDSVARMRATAVIDTIASNMMIGEGSGSTAVPVGGIAHAGARGISKVQVRVDDGPWVDARIRQPLSDTTWAIWRYDWPFQAGRHTFTVRCFEGDGTPQITAEAPPHPSGASGLHRKSAMV